MAPNTRQINEEERVEACLELSDSPVTLAQPTLPTDARLRRVINRLLFPITIAGTLTACLAVTDDKLPSSPATTAPTSEPGDDDSTINESPTPSSPTPKPAPTPTPIPTPVPANTPILDIDLTAPNKCDIVRAWSSSVTCNLICTHSGLEISGCPETEPLFLGTTAANVSRVELTAIDSTTDPFGVYIGNSTSSYSYVVLCNISDIELIQYNGLEELAGTSGDTGSPTSMKLDFYGEPEVMQGSMEGLPTVKDKPLNKINGNTGGIYMEPNIDGTGGGTFSHITFYSQ